MIARAEAHVTRLAMLYALLDRSHVVTAKHLTAALALWQYAENSVRFVFGSSLGNSFADRLFELIRACPDGMTTTGIHQALGNNYPASRIQPALSQLEAIGAVRMEQRKTPGRPAIVWIARWR
jgi:hypothetical protein